MTFKDLQRVIESQPGQGLNQLQRLRGKPFWIWDKTRHKERNRVAKGECCFTHLIALCKKDGIEKPFFDYQRELYKAVMIPGYLNSNPKFNSFNLNNIMYPFKENISGVKKALASAYRNSFLD